MKKKERWNNCINFPPIIRNIKVGEKKRKETNSVDNKYGRIYEF
jgi:hypothetical protein